MSANSHTIGIVEFRMIALGDPQQDAMSRSLQSGNSSSVKRIYAEC